MTHERKTPLTPAPGRGNVVELIKGYILDHDLSPGAPMPTELELSERLGVSRSRVREAIKTLSALDLVEVRHGYGTYVGQLGLSGLVEALAFRGLLSDGARVLGDLVDLRETLETSQAQAIVAGLQTGALLTMRRLVATMQEKAARHEEFPQEDREFHQLLLEPSGNALAVQLAGAFWQVHRIGATRSLRPPTDLGLTADAHATILDAIDSADVERLRAAIRAHYVPIRDRLAVGA